MLWNVVKYANSCGPYNNAVEGIHHSAVAAMSTQYQRAERIGTCLDSAGVVLGKHIGPVLEAF